MKILYINHYAGSLYHGMEYRPYYLAREWVRQGHEVTLVASNYSHLRQKNVVIPLGENYLNEVIDGINYIWCRTPEYTANGFKRVINIFVFLKRLKALKRQLIKNFRPELVIASSTYPFETKLVHGIARQAQAKFVYEVHDLWPLTPIEVGGMSKWHPFIMLMQRAEDYGYKHADKVVSLLPNAKEYMQSHGLDTANFVYIPNGVVVADWLNSLQKLPDEHQNKLTNLKVVENKFIIGYAGGMGEANALKYLLDAARLLNDKPIAFVLIGDGPNKAALIERINREQLNNVHILASISKLAIPAFLSACDGLYIGWNKLPIYRFGICPNKLFDYMLAQKPIIHSVTAGNDLVYEAKCGISLAAEDVIGLAAACTALSQMKADDRAKLAANGYNFVLRNHDYRVLATRFLDNSFS